MSPPPLPGPPADYAALAGRFPTLSKDRLPPFLYRVHQLGNEPEWFGISGNYRWDPLPSPTPTFGTCYVATDPLTALMEVVADLPLVTQSVLDSRSLAMLEIPGDQRVADMTSPKIIGEWGLDRRISTGDDYIVCQAWASALRLAGFTGIYYEPRDDPRGSDHASLAMFGDPEYQPTQIRLIDDVSIGSALQQAATDVFGLRVLPSSAIPPR